MLSRPVFLAAFAHDVEAAILWTERHFGVAASERYEALIRQALHDLQQDPQRAGARLRSELAPNAHTYHLAFSRDHVTGDKVKTPRHLILYRFASHFVEFARLLHDSRDMARHVPKAYRIS